MAHVSRKHCGARFTLRSLAAEVQRLRWRKQAEGVMARVSRKHCGARFTLRSLAAVVQRLRWQRLRWDRQEESLQPLKGSPAQAGLHSPLQ